MRRQALHRKRSGNSDFLLICDGSVVEQLEFSMSLRRSVDFFAAHSLLDVWVVGDRLQRNVPHSLVDKSVPDIVRYFGGRQGLTRKLGFLPTPLSRIR